MSISARHCSNQSTKQSARLWRLGALVLLSTLLPALAWAQAGGQITPAPSGGLPLMVGQGASGNSYSVPIQTLLFFTALSFLPAAVLMMSAAKAAGASYCDVRVGRYLRQFIQTREANVQGVTNTESSGVGVRVIAGGAWGFAATNSLSAEAVADTARQFSPQYRVQVSPDRM